MNCRRDRKRCPEAGAAPRCAKPLWLLLFLALALCGCAGNRAATWPRAFAFSHDTFSFSNELRWVYRQDPVTGKTEQEKRQPKPEYSLHCFPMARAAREFFFHARFEPSLPPTNAAGCRMLIQQVVARSSRVTRPAEERIVIPGYANLREFSAAHAPLLKAECGSRWGSYFQCGNWRMMFPFTRRQQSATARELVDSLQRNRPPIVHLILFPSLSINHAVMLIGVAERENELEFAVYDPNDMARPTTLRFDRQQRRFLMPPSDYFAGGRVDVYEVYNGWCY